MSNKFIKKNIKLSLEFDKYISRNPQAFRKIPSGSCVILTVKNDESFNKESRNMVQKTARKKTCVEARKEGQRWVIGKVRTT